MTITTVRRIVLPIKFPSSPGEDMNPIGFGLMVTLPVAFAMAVVYIILSALAALPM